MHLIIIALSATGALTGRNNGFLRHASSSARQKVLDNSAELLRNELKSAAGTVQQTKSEVTLRDGLGENLPFPAIGYLGTGYDILKGNPEGNSESLIDPGYRGPVVTLTWSQDSRFNTRDMARLVPTQATGLPMVACQHTTKAVEMSEMTDYMDSAEEDASQTTEVGAEGGAFGVSVAAEAKFSSSSGVSDFRQEVLSTDSKRYSMKSFCLQYQMILHTPAKVLETSEYFNKRAAMLDILVPPPKGACLRHSCKNLYIDGASAYIGVSGSKVVLQKEPPSGQWLFDGVDHVYWITPQNNWKLDDTKVLTIQNDKPVIAALNKKKFTNQEWLVDSSLMLISVGSKKAIGYDKEAQLESNGLPALLAKTGVGIAVTQNYFPLEQEGRWLMFIEDFGTHFVHSVQLGGRMVTTVTMSSKDSEEIAKHGETAAWAVAASVKVESTYADVKASHEQNANEKTQKDTREAFGNARKETKTMVLGGDPPEDMSEEKSHGFGEWAGTVSKKPMPVKITLTALDKTEPFQCDQMPPGADSQELQLLNSFRTKKIKEFTYLEKARCKELRATFGAIYQKYQEGSLQRFRTENMEAQAAKETTVNKNSWHAGIYACPSRVKSENGKYTAKFRCDGTFEVLDTFGTVEWAAHPVANKKCSGAKAILVLEKSVFGIKCSADRNALWHVYPTADGCNVADHKKTKLQLLNDGNLLLLSGEANHDHDLAEMKQDGKTTYLWQSGFFESRLLVNGKRYSRYGASIVREQQKGHGHIYCPAAKTAWKKDYLLQVRKEKDRVSEQRHGEELIKRHRETEKERREWQEKQKKNRERSKEFEENRKEMERRLAEREKKNKQ